MIYQSLLNYKDITFKIITYIACLFVSDCLGWKEEVQCELPADVPVDKGANIHDIYRNHCDIDHTCSHDDTRHNCVRPCIHAYRLGNALGKAILLEYNFDVWRKKKDKTISD